MTKKGTTAAKGSGNKSKPAQPSKKDQFLALLLRETGATLAEIVEATGWQAHSARAMLTGLRKQGRTIDKTKVDGVIRYTVRAEPAA
jgi:hypothetical protein